MPLPKSEQLIASHFSFWVFILLFKLAVGIHYAVIGAIGARFLPLWSVGIAVGSMALIECILIIPFGANLHRIGVFRALFLGILATALSAFCLFLPLTPYSYLASAMIAGFGWLFFNPSVDSYLIATAPRSTVGTLLGIRRTMNSLGIALGVLLLPVLVSLPAAYIGFVMLFPLTGSIFGLIVQRRNLPCPPLGPSVIQHRIAESFRTKLLTVLRMPKVLLLAGYTLFNSLLFGVLWFWIPIYLETHPLSPANLGLLVLDAIVIFTGLPIGAFIDTHRKLPIAFLSMSTVVILTFLLAPGKGMIFVLLCAAISIADEFVNLSLWSMLPPKMNLGLATGVINFMNDVGWTVAPILAGFLLSHYLEVAPTLPIGTLGIFLLALGFFLLPRINKAIK